jgi:hypothetical protein
MIPFSATHPPAFSAKKINIHATHPERRPTQPIYHAAKPQFGRAKPRLHHATRWHGRTKP